MKTFEELLDEKSLRTHCRVTYPSLLDRIVAIPITDELELELWKIKDNVYEVTLTKHSAECTVQSVQCFDAIMHYWDRYVPLHALQVAYAWCVHHETLKDVIVLTQETRLTARETLKLKSTVSLYHEAYLRGENTPDEMVTPDAVPRTVIPTPSGSVTISTPDDGSQTTIELTNHDGTVLFQMGVDHTDKTATIRQEPNADVGIQPVHNTLWANHVNTDADNIYAIRRYLVKGMKWSDRELEAMIDTQLSEWRDIASKIFSEEVIPKKQVVLMLIESEHENGSVTRTCTLFDCRNLSMLLNEEGDTELWDDGIDVRKTYTLPDRTDRCLYRVAGRRSAKDIAASFQPLPDDASWNNAIGSTDSLLPFISAAENQHRKTLTKAKAQTR